MCTISRHFRKTIETNGWCKPLDDARGARRRRNASALESIGNVPLTAKRFARSLRQLVL